MDTGQSFSKSELNVLWYRKSKRYTIKSFVEDGHWITHLVLHDKCAGGRVIGKLVERSSEEFRHRPWLHHRNLASLIDMVTVNDDFTAFISVYQEKSLREVIHDKTFVQNSNCFTLKKIYLEDVLWGLDYLHRNGLCLMNLSDANVSICEQPNKVVITDFGCLAETKKQGCKFDVPFIHQPPEIRMDSPQCDLISAEMWITGMMALEIFTQHKLPWALVDYNPDRALEMVARVDFEILKFANAGSRLFIQDLCEFKTFVGSLIDNNPQRRLSARDAASSTFLLSPKHSVSLKKLAGNGSENNESASFPSIHHRSPCHFKSNSRSNCSLHSLKATRIHFDENKTEKSTSSLSFKKCVIPAKLVNSDSQSQQPDFAEFDNNVVSGSFNQVFKNNSETNSNIGSMPQGNHINCVNDIKPLSKSESKIGLYSQVELMDYSSETSANVTDLNNDNATSVCSDGSLNEAIDFNPMHTRFNIQCEGHSPTLIREESGSTNMLSPATGRSRKNVSDSYRNISNENKMNNSTSRSVYQENSHEKVRAKCDIDICVSSNNNYEDCLRDTSSDRSSTFRILRSQRCLSGSTQNIMDDYNRNAESKVVLKNSNHKFRISVPKNRQVTCHMDPKNEEAKFTTEPSQKRLSSSTQNIMDDYNRITESKVVLNNSNNKFRISVPKNCQETCRLDSKIEEAKVATKTPYTLSKSNVFSLQKSTANDAPGLMPKTDKSILNALVKAHLKEIQQTKIKEQEEVKEQENRLVNNVQAPNMPITGFNNDNRPSVEESFAMATTKDTQTVRIKKVPYCRFQHGYRCPKHQTAELLARLRKTINQEENFCKCTEEYASKNKCKNCGNTKIEYKVSDNNSGNSLAFPTTGSSLHHEYWFPTSSFSNARNAPILSPSPLSQISGKSSPGKEAKEAVVGTQRLSSAIWGKESLHKDHNPEKGLEEVPKEENHLQKMVLVRGPIVKGRSVYRMEQVQTKHVKYMKKNVKKDALKKGKKSAKKGGLKNSSTEGMVVEGSSDEKKSSKKMSTLKKCFCIGK